MTKISDMIVVTQHLHMYSVYNQKTLKRSSGMAVFYHSVTASSSYHVTGTLVNWKEN